MPDRLAAPEDITRPPHDLGPLREAARRRRLSRRQVKHLATVGQWWESESTGAAWRIYQLHRKDDGERPGALGKPVELVRPGEGKRFLTFGELAHGYRLLDVDEIPVDG